MHSTAAAALCAAVLASAAATVRAADPPDQVVVTATRSQQNLDDTLATVTLIDRDAIERLQPRSVEDLLRGIEGLSIANTGGPGKATSLFVRGTESDHVLVLIDGVKVGSATVGTMAIENVPIEQIDRIEFVRGPRSSLYGSEAIGGVLQLFTRRGGGALTTSANATGGSFGTREIDAAIRGGGERAWFNARYGYQQIDGFNACTGSSTLFAGCFTEEPDKDRYQYRSGALRAGYRLTDGSEVEASWLRAESAVDFDGSFTNQTRIVQQVAGLRGSVNLADHWKLGTSAGRSWDQSDSFLDGAFVGYFDTMRDSASLQLEFDGHRGHRLFGGMDYLRDKVDSDTDYAVQSRSNRGGYLQYIGAVGRLHMEASGRHDDNGQFGSATTGGLALGYRISSALELIAQHGTAFKAPTFNELYFPFFGNPDLTPERSRSSELSARGSLGVARWRVSAYQTQIRDLIGYDANFAPANIDLARIRGLETRIDATVGAWRAGAGLSWLDPTNVSAGPDFGKTLPRRARSSARIDLDRRFASFGIGATLLAEGQRFDDQANTRRLGGYATVDLRADWPLADTWQLQARIANLLDRDYETVSFYEQAGRAAYLTVRFTGLR